MLDFKKYGDAEAPLKFFEEFSKIPHGSENTSAFAEYLCDFAKKRGLYYRRDEANNVIIKKPATKGYENRPAIIFQGHPDMVAEKKPRYFISRKLGIRPPEMYIVTTNVR